MGAITQIALVFTGIEMTATQATGQITASHEAGNLHPEEPAGRDNADHDRVDARAIAEVEEVQANGRAKADQHDADGRGQYNAGNNGRPIDIARLVTLGDGSFDNGDARGPIKAHNGCS